MLFSDPVVLVSTLSVGVGISILAFIFFFRKKSVKTQTSVVSESSKLVPPAKDQPTSASRVHSGMSRTREYFRGAFDRLFSGSQGSEFFSNLEEVLLSADVGIEYAEKIIQKLKEPYGLRTPSREELKSSLHSVLVSGLPKGMPLLDASSDAHPHVVMIVGVNGAGKTTTIAKLCALYRAKGRRVLVGAADTFRAAAVEQLKTWVERTGAEGVFQKEGTDPSAVAFDTVAAAVSRKVDLCLVDTAGRLHTKVNLMEELKKMKRVIAKADSTAPHDVWLVVDGSTGQNALRQAKEFHAALSLTGVVVTKLDGSSKGGAVLALSTELGIPIMFIGVGESPEDLVPFDANPFVDAILTGL